MKKLIIFNWKMNPSSLREAEILFNSIPKKIKNLSIVIAAPFVYLENLKLKTKNLKLAAQNVFWAESGAFTGEVSPKMLKNLGIKYVIIGHSERRKYLNESDEMINKKIKSALNAGLKVVLCVGEQSRPTTNNKQQITKVKKYVKKQLQKDLNNSKSLILNSKLRNHLVIAYEPVWAIGTGRVCPPKDALEMIKFIKQFLNSKFSILNSRVLYGGSVDSKNIKNFVKYEEVDGALVGGASLKKDEVRRIIKTVSKYDK